MGAMSGKPMKARLWWQHRRIVARARGAAGAQGPRKKMEVGPYGAPWHGCGGPGSPQTVKLGPWKLFGHRPILTRGAFA